MPGAEAIDIIAKLAQGGIVVILLVMIAGMAYAIRTMWKEYVDLAERAIAAIQAGTSAIEGHTRAVEANARAAETNKIAIDALKNVLLATRT